MMCMPVLCTYDVHVAVVIVGVVVVIVVVVIVVVAALVVVVGLGSSRRCGLHWQRTPEYVCVCLIDLSPLSALSIYLSSLTLPSLGVSPAISQTCSGCCCFSPFSSEASSFSPAHIHIHIYLHNSYIHNISRYMY